MRRGVLLFLVLTLGVFAYLISSVWTLLTLLVADGTKDALTKAELSAPGSDALPQLIPKLIHQTYKNESIPLAWQEAQASCLALHQEPEWEYKLWTDTMAVDFIELEYPWFLKTFTSYKYNIQRADAIRYFVLRHYGGVYIDLDDGCNRALDPLLSYPAFARRTIPTGISNDVLGAVPHHPFFEKVTEEIDKYDRSWLLPYITVMGSTGPLFLSVLWRHWSAAGNNTGDGADGGRIRLIFPEEYNGQAWSFFTHHVGNSWHKWDVRLIFWMAKHWALVTAMGFLVGGSVLVLVWLAYNRCVLGSADALRGRATTKGYALPFWRRSHAKPEGFRAPHFNCTIRSTTSPPQPHDRSQDAVSQDVPHQAKARESAEAKPTDSAVDSSEDWQHHQIQRQEETLAQDSHRHLGDSHTQHSYTTSMVERAGGRWTEQESGYSARAIME